MAEDFGAAAFFHDGENRAEVVGIVEPDFERKGEEDHHASQGEMSILQQ